MTCGTHALGPPTAAETHIPSKFPHHFAPVKDARYCDIRVSMSVCSLNSKTNVSELHEIFCTCFLRPWLGHSLTTTQYYYVLPVLRMTSRFHIIAQYRYRFAVCDVANNSP